MRKSFKTAALALAVLLAGVKGYGQAVRTKRIALASTDNKMLQAYASVGASGELHASNSHINQEEAWWLYVVGKSG